MAGHVHFSRDTESQQVTCHAVRVVPLDLPFKSFSKLILRQNQKRIRRDMGVRKFMTILFVT